ncbi:MAG: hydrolase, CocE/NonD family [Ktedonobacterales bacterium]|jgi:putative CocE/NonD family hydrolase|nr:MAG: hydrolase, CocE/NonD family [Ktedonobacterales bacterium]
MQPGIQNGVRVTYNVPSIMRDGTVLHANVYQPDDGGTGSYPVLLTRMPYGKDLPAGVSALLPEQAARRGYIVVVQDVRGTGASEGDWSPLLHEAQDGFDTVAWAAQLPGADGRVGMYGVSYFGFTQWAAASQHPPALRAIAPMQTWNDLDAPDAGVLWRNGVLELGASVGWALEMGFDQMVRRYRGNAEAMGRAIYGLAREVDALPTSGYGELPLASFGPLARTGLDAPNRIFIAARDEADVVAAGRIARAYELELPVLHIGGWYDLFLGGTLRNFQEMRNRGHQRQWLVIGPWTHGNVNRVQGDLDFGFASSGALMDLRIDLMSLQIQFFDYALKGLATTFAEMPVVKYFVMGANVWKTSKSWPPEGATVAHWYLHSAGHANTASGDGQLSNEQPADEVTDSFTYDPANPVPTVGGATLLPSVLRPGPRDQRVVEQRHDVLVYTSAPLEQPLEVTGAVSAALYVASDAPDTDFVARLVDVYPDGMAITVTDGIVRMRHRNGMEAREEPLEAGTFYRIEVDLWATSLVFLPGHRIRLDVTSSSFPRWERNLNTGMDSAAATEMRTARQSLAHDAEHPSYLALPIMA